MFDSLKSKLKNVFKKAPAEIAEPSVEPQEQALAPVVEEQPQVQLSRKEGHKEVYRMLGASEVIIPEEATALSLANQIMSDSILDYYQLAENYTMVKIFVGDGFEPKSIIDMNVRVLFDINIVGVIKDDKFAIPKANDLIVPGDVLVVVGTKENYQKFESFLNEKPRAKAEDKKPAKAEEKKDTKAPQAKPKAKK